nr:retrovirus-related Pol polyprotein from transposon TNT 1-94 [Tanacetum cinerariifolium]
MMGNRKLFLTYKAYDGGNVGSNLRGNIIGKCTISSDSLNIDDVGHVDNLRFNLQSVGQICDNKCKVIFSEHDSEITKDRKVIGRGISKSGLYVMKLGKKPKDKVCLLMIVENSTLWHMRLGHANMRLIQSFSSKELVRNLPKLKFGQNFCDACKTGKQAHASHKAKNIVLTTRCLELLHMDLFGLSVVRSYGGNLYTLVIVDDYSRCGDPNHLIGECPKPPKDKNQRAFVRGSWSDSGEEDDEKVNNETCLVAPASKKVSTLEKNKRVDLECVKCHMLKIENEKLKEEVTRLNRFEKSTHCLNEMLSNQKLSGEKFGVGFNSFEASSSGTKEIKFMKALKKASSDGGLINMSVPQSVQAAPQKIMGPPPVGTPGSEK